MTRIGRLADWQIVDLTVFQSANLPMPVSPQLISIIVPVYNEAGTVRQVIERLLQIPLPAAREIIVVNDGSTDGTRDVLDGITPVDGVLSIVHAAANGGKGSALRIGLSHARGTIVAIQDADLELDPVQLGNLVQPILDGEADVVYGSRFLTGRPSGAVALGRRESRADVADQRVIPRAPHRYGNLLQDHGGPGRAQSRARVEPLRHRAGNYGEAAAQGLPHCGAPGRRSIRETARAARRLAGATGSTRSPCCSNTDSNENRVCCDRAGCGSCRRRGRLRARHLCRRRIGLVVLCAHGRCVRGRPSAADERARCAGAVAGCAEDIHAGRLRCRRRRILRRRRRSARPAFLCCSRRSSRLAASTRSSSSRRLRVRCSSG